MSRINGSAPMFTEEDIKEATRPNLPRLIRIAFYRLGITNDSYIDAYKEFYKRLFPDRSQKEFTQKAAADRKFLMEPKKLTFNMMSNVLMAMRWDIIAIQITMKNRVTDEELVVSTDTTVEELQRQVAQESEIGIGGL